MKHHGGTNHPRHRMRCSQGSKGCGARFTLPRRPELYKRPVRCPFCGCEDLQDVEAARRVETDNEDRCFCNSYPFPHRKGSLRVCVHHPDYHVPLEYWEECEYNDCLKTPRSGVWWISFLSGMKNNAVSLACIYSQQLENHREITAVFGKFNVVLVY